MEKICQSLTLAFRPKVPWQELQAYRASGSAENAMQGEMNGLDLLLFDWITPPIAGSWREAKQTVVVFPEGTPGLPRFSLWPRKGGLMEAVASMVVGDPSIGKQDCFEFYQSYIVEANDLSAVQRLLTVEKMRLLARHDIWKIEVYDGHCAIYQPG